MFQAWLAAFNSGDEAQYKMFDDAYQPKRPMTQMAGFRKQTGGFALVRVEKSDATSITGFDPPAATRVVEFIAAKLPEAL